MRAGSDPRPDEGEQRPPGAARQRAGIHAGELLITGGGVILLTLVYELYGTGLTNPREQARLEDELALIWSEAQPRPAIPRTLAQEQRSPRPELATPRSRSQGCRDSGATTNASSAYDLTCRLRYDLTCWYSAWGSWRGVASGDQCESVFEAAR